MKIRNAGQLRGLNEGMPLINLFEFTFTDGSDGLYLTDAPFNISEFGIDYISSGILIAFGDSKENGSIKPSSFAISLSGTDQTAIRLVADPANLYASVVHRQAYWEYDTDSMSGGSFIVRDGKVVSQKYTDNREPIAGLTIANKWTAMDSKNMYTADNGFWSVQFDNDTFFKYAENT